MSDLPDIEYCEECGEELGRDGHQILEASTCEKCGTLMCLDCYEQLHACEGRTKDG